MGTVGDSYDNALAENFWSVLKTECVRRAEFATRRRHRRLPGQRPGTHPRTRTDTTNRVRPTGRTLSLSMGKGNIAHCTKSVLAPRLSQENTPQRSTSSGDFGQHRDGGVYRHPKCDS